MIDHKDSWKNRSVFEEQLSLNKKELRTYPNHWNSFVKCIKHLNRKVNLLDVGCGTGVYKKICQDNFGESVSYTGIDYSEDAIQIANSEWDGGFICMDVFDLNPEFLQKYDALHLGALLDVLQNAEDAMNFILSFDTKNVIIGRVLFSFGPSEAETYKAYDKITTYRFKHNKKTFHDIIEMNNYKVILNDGETFLLEKT